MFNELAKIEFDNEIKSRRSVIAVSSVLLIFSNIELKSDTLKILSLEVQVSHVALIGALKFVLLIALVAFAFSHIERLPIRISRFLRKRDQKWWKPIEDEISVIYAQMNPDYDYDEQMREAQEPYRDWDDEAYHEKFLRKQRRIKIHNYYRAVASFSRTVSRLIWPIGLALIALFYPSLPLIFSTN